ncbi:aldolase [Bradyrhizobium sp. NAS80.1]|uniref:HpcH/HpaI aldolase/citrate lyase family protein n=1 Tax=Bradyrhizobium sp. NAS80.1 TaxID=1680159 RepID=UPI000967F015|nr:CoA ester lyase [Bradyrhizobium sp. NAS80.1]OKO85367.1 aldolase [Bradyrhizobium sp. NAS80.1]
MVTPAVAACIAPLFVPGDRPERFAKAAVSGADAVIIDLEDAVSPSQKARARISLSGPLPSRTIVRINGPQTVWFSSDLKAIEGLPLAGVMVPKVESAGEVSSIRAALGDVAIFAIVESARGLSECKSIAVVADRLAFGSIDFVADLGCSHERESLLCARSDLVLASRLSNLPPPLDGVTLEIDDTARISDDARYAASLGFGGKLCIHPRQISPTRAGFHPTKSELEWAESIPLDGTGVVSIGGKMIDEPVRLNAKRILARAKACSECDGDAAPRT